MEYGCRIDVGHMRHAARDGIKHMNIAKSIGVVAGPANDGHGAIG
jgi:hypothetical protein